VAVGGFKKCCIYDEKAGNIGSVHNSGSGEWKIEYGNFEKNECETNSRNVEQSMLHEAE
jgi:hypothetical protein